MARTWNPGRPAQQTGDTYDYGEPGRWEGTASAGWDRPYDPQNRIGNSVYEYRDAAGNVIGRFDGGSWVHNGALTPQIMQQLVGDARGPYSNSPQTLGFNNFNDQTYANDQAMKGQDTGFGEGTLIASALAAFVTAGLSAAASSGGLFSSAPGYWGGTGAAGGTSAAWSGVGTGNPNMVAGGEGVSGLGNMTASQIPNSFDAAMTAGDAAAIGPTSSGAIGNVFGGAGNTAGLASAEMVKNTLIQGGVSASAAATAAQAVASGQKLDTALKGAGVAAPLIERILSNPGIASAIGGLAAGAIGSAISGNSGNAAAGDANASRLTGLQGDAAAQQMKITDQQLKVYNEEVLPLIRAEVTRANNPDRINQAVATAAGDMKAQYAGAKASAARATELSGRVADPIYQSEQNKFAAAESADVAQAITQARTAEADRARQERIQAISLYQNPVGAATAAAGSAGALYGGAANTAMTGARLAADTSARAGYAAAQTFGPAISKGINTWFGAPAETPAVAGYDAYGNPKRTGYTAEDSSYDPNWSGGGWKDGGAIRRGYAEGGPVEGPGTGTSDSISTAKAPGTFILSADTVRAIGTKKITDLMEKAGVRPGDGESPDPGGRAVRLSSGEWAVPPAATMYHGENFFNALQKKFHRPVMDEPGGAANGGAIRVRAMPRSVEDAIMGVHRPMRAIRRM